MTDEALLQQMLISPCINICSIDDDSGYCRGCWRTREEIAAWGLADEDARREILERLAERRGAKTLTDPGRGMLGLGDD